MKRTMKLKPKEGQRQARSHFSSFFVVEPEIFALYLKIIQAKLHKYKKNSTNKYEREMEDSFPSELRHHISKKM